MLFEIVIFLGVLFAVLDRSKTFKFWLFTQYPITFTWYTKFIDPTFDIPSPSRDFTTTFRCITPDFCESLPSVPKAPVGMTPLFEHESKPTLTSSAHAVMTLNNRAQSLDIFPPRYDYFRVGGEAHCPEFVCFCNFQNRSVQAKGASKREAKENSARAMLELLDLLC